MPRLTGCPAVAAGVALVIALALTACQDGDPSPSPAPTPQPIPTPTPVTPQVDPACGPGNGTRQTLEPQTQEEALVVDDVTLCTDGDNGTYLRNGSSAVLVIDAPSGIGPLSFPATAPVAVQVFSAAFTGNPQNLPQLPPGGSAYLQVDPAQLHIRLDPGSQVLWDVVERGVDKVEEQSQDAALSLLAAGSPTRKALLGCAVSGYEDGRKILDAWTGDDAGEVVSDALGLRSDLSSCTRELDEASRTEPVERQRILTGEKLASSLEVPQLSDDLDASMRLLRKVTEVHLRIP